MCNGYGWIASGATRNCDKITTGQEKLHFSRVVTEKLRQFSYLNFSIQILMVAAAAKDDPPQQPQREITLKISAYRDFGHVTGI